MPNATINGRKTNKPASVIPFIERPGGHAPHVWGYARISTLDQDQNCRSQVEMIQGAYNGLLKGRRVTVGSKVFDGYFWGGIFIDPATSGGKPMAERDAGKVMLDMLQPGDMIVFAKYDRFSRSELDFAQMLKKFTAMNVTLYGLDLGVDTSTDAGRLVAKIMVAVGAFERERIGTRTREFHVAAGMAGYYTWGGMTPSGFEKFLVWDGKRHVNQLRPCPKEQAYMRRMYEMVYLENIPTQAIFEHLRKHKALLLRPSKNKSTVGGVQFVTSNVARWDEIAGTDADVVSMLGPEELERLLKQHGEATHHALTTRPEVRARHRKRSTVYTSVRRSHALDHARECTDRRAVFATGKPSEAAAGT